MIATIAAVLCYLFAAPAALLSMGSAGEFALAKMRGGRR